MRVCIKSKFRTIVQKLYIDPILVCTITMIMGLAIVILIAWHYFLPSLGAQMNHFKLLAERRNYGEKYYQKHTKIGKTPSRVYYDRENKAYVEMDDSEKVSYKVNNYFDEFDNRRDIVRQLKKDIVAGDYGYDNVSVKSNAKKGTYLKCSSRSQKISLDVYPDFRTYGLVVFYHINRKQIVYAGSKVPYCGPYV